MKKKESQTTRRRRPDKKASASARSGLLGAVSLLGASLGVSDAAPLDGSGPAASVKDAAAGEKLVQSVTIKYDKSRKARRKIRPVESNQIKWRKPQSNQIKWRKP